MKPNQLQAVLEGLQELLANYPMDVADERLVSWAVYYLQLVNHSGLVEGYAESK
jgi:hypothetical protein